VKVTVSDVFVPLAFTARTRAVTRFS